MWLCKAGNVVLVPDHMPETIQRCLGDGWVEVSDPRPPLPDPEQSESIIITLDGQTVARAMRKRGR